MITYKILSMLLDYPDEELKASLSEIADIITEDQAITAHERDALLKLVEWMSGASLIELQSAYVQTFDLTAEHSLHLTHHTFGDSRERGPALVELVEFYKAHGLDTVEKELPDYLPLILEYASTLESFEARMFLGETARVLEVIAVSLEDKKSPWAPALRLIESHGRLARSAA